MIDYHDDDTGPEIEPYIPEPDPEAQELAELFPGEIDNLTAVTAIARAVAGDMQSRGVDPKTIAPADAWSYYVETNVRGLRDMGAWNSAPQVYKDFLQLESPGGKMFQEIWLTMSRRALLEAGGLVLPPPGARVGRLS